MARSLWFGFAFAGLICSAFPLQANEPGLSPEQEVRRYSRTVACQFDRAVEGLKRFAAVQLVPGYADCGFGAIWLTVRGTTGRKAYGTHTELSMRYRWHGGWNPAERCSYCPRT